MATSRRDFCSKLAVVMDSEKGFAWPKSLEASWNCRGIPSFLRTTRSVWLIASDPIMTTRGSGSATSTKNRFDDQRVAPAGVVKQRRLLLETGTSRSALVLGNAEVAPQPTFTPRSECLQTRRLPTLAGLWPEDGQRLAVASGASVAIERASLRTFKTFTLEI